MCVLPTWRLCSWLGDNCPLNCFRPIRMATARRRHATCEQRAFYVHQNEARWRVADALLERGRGRRLTVPHSSFVYGKSRADEPYGRNANTIIEITRQRAAIAAKWDPRRRLPTRRVVRPRLVTTYRVSAPRSPRAFLRLALVRSARA